jgi:hypothetical protein
MTGHDVTGRRAGRLWLGLGEQLDQAAAGGELLSQFPAALVPGVLQVLQGHRDGGDVRGHGPAEEFVPVVDPDLGQVPRGRTGW